MPSKILSCTKGADGYRVRVHLDTDRLVSEEEAASILCKPGDPHPKAVCEWTWGLPQKAEQPLHKNGGHAQNGEFHHAAHTQHGKDITEQQYLENIFAMLPEMIEREVLAMEVKTHHDKKREVVPHLHGKEIH
jgi:hypothetical protein